MVENYLTVKSNQGEAENEDVCEAKHTQLYQQADKNGPFFPVNFLFCAPVPG